MVCVYISNFLLDDRRLEKGLEGSLMKEETFLKRFGNPRVAQFGFKDGIRVSLAKPYEYVDDLIRPESFKAENPDEFYN